MVERHNSSIRENTNTTDSYASELYQTQKSLESLRQEATLSESEKKAIQKLPDYNPRATPEEQKAREDYFIKLKNELIAEIQKQGNESPLSKVLQTIEKNTDKDGNIITDSTKVVKTSGKTDFERFIIYLGNKNALQSDPVACSAIDLRIRSHEPTASSYLLQRRDDYFHILETIANSPKQKNKQKQKEHNTNVYNNIPKETEAKTASIRSTDNREEIVISHNTDGFNMNTTESLGIERSPSGVTLCSRTAWRNLTEKLGITPPPPRAGSALVSMLSPEYQDYTPLVGSVFTNSYKTDWNRAMPQGSQTISCHDNQGIIDQLKNPSLASNAICGEIYLSSRGYPQYGHRAALCKGTDNQRYVLDPYVGRAGTKPQALADYIEKCTNGKKAREIYRINLFQSSAQNP